LFRQPGPPLHAAVDYITTYDFLLAMELEGVIPSANAVFDRAQAAMPARNVRRLRKMTEVKLAQDPSKE
jgi:hypothetical protein